MKKRKSWNEYYEQVIMLPHRPPVEEAVALLHSKQAAIAIDCGCGAGRDSAYLLNQGLTVHAFDLDADAIRICQRRFAEFDNYTVSQASFDTFAYVSADLVIANAALFFCPPTKFQTAWQKITQALKPGGVFCGDFLGVRDGWLADDKGELSAFSAEQVRALFTGFDIQAWHEKDEVGRQACGHPKHWHYFSVIAKKSANTAS